MSGGCCSTYVSSCLYMVGVKDNTSARRKTHPLLDGGTDHNPTVCPTHRLMNLALHCVWGLQIVQKMQHCSLSVTVLFFPTLHLQALEAIAERSHQRGNHQFLPSKNLNPRVTCMTSYKKKQAIFFLDHCSALITPKHNPHLKPRESAYFLLLT